MPDVRLTNAPTGRYYERDFVTRFVTIRLRIARARGKSFLPPAMEKFQRRAPELAMLIREAFLRGISTRQAGRLVATLTGETVSAQTVSQLTRDLDGAVRQFHRAPLKDEWAYLFLDGVSLGVRRAAGRQRVQMLVAYGVAPGRNTPTAGLSAHPAARARPTGSRCSTICTGAG